MKFDAVNENILTVWIPVWGAHHIGLMENFLIPSLLQPGNLSSLRGQIHFDICTTAESVEEVNRSAQRALAGWKTCSVSIAALPDGSQVISRGFLNSIRSAIAARSRMLLAMPDTVFGNGSIGNLARYAFGKNICIAAAHLRVEHDAYMKATGGKFSGASNAELVDVAEACAHQTARESHCESENCSWAGGISLTHIAPGLHAMIHHLPTPYLVFMTREDEEFFAHGHLGFIDHVWPEKLVESGRLRVIGSSELFFAVEITATGNNTQPIKPNSQFEEAYCGQFKHHRANSMFVTALQGKK